MVDNSIKNSIHRIAYINEKLTSQGSFNLLIKTLVKYLCQPKSNLNNCFIVAITINVNDSI